MGWLEEPDVERLRDKRTGFRDKRLTVVGSQRPLAGWPAVRTLVTNDLNWAQL